MEISASQSSTSGGARPVRPQQPPSRAAAEAAAQAGQARNDALAEGRARNISQSTADAETQQARAAEALAATREAIARAIGANTRLSISRGAGATEFIYRAIDIDSGEVVQEWPQGAFLNLIRGVREDVAADVTAGLVLDETA